MRKASQTPSTSELAVQVKPAPGLAHKAAVLMLAHGFASHAKAGHKLHLGLIWAGQCVAAHLQPQQL